MRCRAAFSSVVGYVEDGECGPPEVLEGILCRRGVRARYRAAGLQTVRDLMDTCSFPAAKRDVLAAMADCMVTSRELSADPTDSSSKGVEHPLVFLEGVGEAERKGVK